MLTAHVALVSEDSKITPSELSKVAGALSKQVSRDFGPIWKVNADVAAYEKLEDVPLDYWPIIVKDDIGDPSAAGYHEDKHGQPFSLVQYDRSWSLTASHECLEMLADPFGRRVVASDSPVKGQGRVNFLVEVCDPCEGSDFAYTINGIQVSDFFTPNFFDPVSSSGVRYSYTGALKEPRQVLKDGYLSWLVPSTPQVVAENLVLWREAKRRRHQELQRQRNQYPGGDRPAYGTSAGQSHWKGKPEQQADGNGKQEPAGRTRRLCWSSQGASG